MAACMGSSPIAAINCAVATLLALVQDDKPGSHYRKYSAVGETKILLKND